MYISQELFVNLIPGEYIISVGIKGYFIDSIRKLFENGNSITEKSRLSKFFFGSGKFTETGISHKDFCHSFDFDMQIVELKLSNDYKNKIQGPYVIKEQELSQIISSDSSLAKNTLVSVDPSQSNDIKLFSKLEITLKFQFALRMIYSISYLMIKRFTWQK